MSIESPDDGLAGNGTEPEESAPTKDPPANREHSAFDTKLDTVLADQKQLGDRLTAIEAMLSDGMARMDVIAAAEKHSVEAVAGIVANGTALDGRLNELANRVETILAQPTRPQTLPGILLTTMPKSGSVYIMRTLARSLDIEFMTDNVAHGFFPNYFLIPNRLDRINNGDIVRHEHFDASTINVDMLVQRDQRLVLHLRDPRQATVSWLHHFNLMVSSQPGTVNYTVNTPPPDYFAWPTELQLDWQIESHLRSMEQWLRGWINHTGAGSPLKILITRYEDMLADEAAFFRQLTDFFDIPPERFEYKPAPRTIANNFRKGQGDEWKTVFSEAQKARAIEVIGADVLQHFGWEI